MSHAALVNSVQKALDPIRQMPEVMVTDLFRYLHSELAGIWFGTNVISYADAVCKLNLEKSAGYPYYYDCVDKGDALRKYGDRIQREVQSVLSGDELWLPFSLTLKDELRTKERVAANKTRGFSASGIVHLLASKVVFSRQNEKLVQTLGAHPVTLGIQVPGQQYVRFMLSLGSEQNCYDADGDGCDQRFQLQVARCIRDLRKCFLPVEYGPCVDLLYDAVYAGDVIALGVVYRMFHNKSGWECTGHDNSLYMWGAIWLAVTQLSGRRFSDVCKLLVNGDDLAFSVSAPGVGVVEISNFLKKFGIIIGYEVAVPRRVAEIVFLSHHLRERFVSGVGDPVICAGNYAKIVSSINWIKSSDLLSFEESCLAHLVGLRICLWPWYDDFVENEERIDQFLASRVPLSKNMLQILKARISEKEIVGIYLGLESKGFLIDLLSGDMLNVRRLIKKTIRKLILNNAQD